MSFADFFCAATGNRPFPWQTALYEKFSTGQFPTSANIPTGLGKTSMVAVWLIALAHYPHRVPRRLVYVVNRRTVVDQTTAEVEKLRMALSEKTELKEVRDKLLSLCALPLPAPDSSPLAVSTLRGQFADNREWSADPTRPAVIIGTVDMIGSGLLFSRYTVGFKLRPHHAAFLAQDALLIHDEAHLEPAFQQLLNSIVAEQARSNDLRNLQVIELSATTRSEASSEPFKITEDDNKNEFVNKRLNAVKKLSLVALGDGENERDKIVELALTHKDTGRAILVFVRSVESAAKIAAKLDKGELKDKVLTLTGTMRGKERDELVNKPIFQRFLPESSRAAAASPSEGTVFLVATSAGEVGVNISGEDLICDLSTYESMAQRFGRVNRFGKCGDSTITVVYPQEFTHTKKIKEVEEKVKEAEKAVAEGKKDAEKRKKDAEKKLLEAKDASALGIAIENTLELLRKLDGYASPAALEKLPADERAAAFSPPPKMRVATDVQFDAWALTSIRGRIAARPPVAPYLHGKAEWEPPVTHVAWREEVDVIQGELLKVYPPAELLEDFPLKPHELLHDATGRVSAAICELTVKSETALNAWIIAESGEVEIKPLSNFADVASTYAKPKSQRTPEETRRINDLETKLADATLILPASLGGIRDGLLSVDAAGNSAGADVAEIPTARMRIHAAAPEVSDQYTSGYRLIRAIDTKFDDDDDEAESPNRYWLWLESKNAVNAEKRTTQQSVTLGAHTMDIAANAAAIVEKLVPAASGGGEPDLRHCTIIAAKLHDPGKNRYQWQYGIGNAAYDPANPETILAKSGGSMRPRNLAENYRHEFGSLADASVSVEIAALSPVERDIVLHLVAAHHGRARPHFPAEEIFDYNSMPDVSAALAAEVPRRFARLQRRFGRWGLVWLESLLRAADYAASAGIVANNPVLPSCRHAIFPENEDEMAIPQEGETMIKLRVDGTNPGQYFACCGLFELVARMAPDVLTYFKQDAASGQWRFIITNCVTHDGAPLSLCDLLTRITNAEITAIEPDDVTSTPLLIGAPFDFRIDWWKMASVDTSALKVWAGSMEPLRIALAMRNAINTALHDKTLPVDEILFDSRVAYDPYNPSEKKEPFYFDATRGPNADSRDVGFAPNDLKLETVASPAVEFLCFVGLQRAIPVPGGQPRQFVYNLWTRPLPVSLLSAAVNGYLPDASDYSYRFESWFRTSQKKHKAFLQATPTKKRTDK